MSHSAPLATTSEIVHEAINESPLNATLKAALESALPAWSEQLGQGSPVDCVLADLHEMERDIQALKSKITADSAHLVDQAKDALENFDFNQCEKEGWAIFECGSHADGPYQLQRIEDESAFSDDYDAQSFVYEEATKGSPLHLEAMNILAQLNPMEYRAIIKNNPPAQQRSSAHRP